MSVGAAILIIGILWLMIKSPGFRAIVVVGGVVLVTAFIVLAKRHDDRIAARRDALRAQGYSLNDAAEIIKQEELSADRGAGSAPSLPTCTPDHPVDRKDPFDRAGLFIDCASRPLP